jgi:4-azaleucine resistance transporter AzlC
MGSIWRTPAWSSIDRRAGRDIGLACFAVFVFGVSYGAIAVAGGLPLWVPAMLSVLVMAGSSELLFVGIVAAGGNPLAAALAGVLVNSRHLPYGLALPAGVAGRGWRAILGTHLMNDETVVFALAQDRAETRRAVFWTCGCGVLIAWPAGAVSGALLGGIVRNTSALGLDAVFPAMILALIFPALRDGGRRLRAAAIAGAGIALAGTACGLPAGLPVLLALAAVVVAC